MTRQQDPTLQLLPTQEAAGLLGLTARAMEERRRRGDGPPYIRVGHTTVRYRLSDLLQWLEDRTFCSTSEEVRAQQ